MKKTNDKLFLLISRLTAPEKGYINKRLKASNPDSHLISLFLTICKCAPQTENALKKKLKNKYILNNFPSIKFQLYERVLKILRDYRRSKGQESEVLNIFKDIDLLFEKKIYKECEKLIKKAIKICDAHELHGFKLQLLAYKQRIQRMKRSSENLLPENSQQLKKDPLNLEKYGF